MAIESPAEKCNHAHCCDRRPDHHDFLLEYRENAAWRSFSRRWMFRSETRGLFARTGLVDLEGLAVHVAAVETGDRGLPLIVGSEFDEAEALRFAAAALGGDIRRNELSIR